jgi:hypothetical protein
MPKKSIRRKNKRNLKRRSFRKKGGQTPSRGLGREFAMKITPATFTKMKSEDVYHTIILTMRRYTDYKRIDQIEKAGFEFYTGDNGTFGEIIQNNYTYLGQCVVNGNLMYKHGFGRLEQNGMYEYGYWDTDERNGIHLTTPVKFKVANNGKVDCIRDIEVTYWYKDQKQKNTIEADNLQEKYQKACLLLQE